MKGKTKPGQSHSTSSSENIRVCLVWSRDRMKLYVFNFELKIEKIKKNSKNIARCIKSNGVKTFQILVHLFFCVVLEVQPANLFSFFFFLVKLLMLTNYTKRTNI
jgi:hypothetical protein